MFICVWDLLEYVYVGFIRIKLPSMGSKSDDPSASPGRKNLPLKGCPLILTYTAWCPYTNR